MTNQANPKPPKWAVDLYHAASEDAQKQMAAQDETFKRMWDEDHPVIEASSLPNVTGRLSAPGPNLQDIPIPGRVDVTDLYARKVVHPPLNIPDVPMPVRAPRRPAPPAPRPDYIYGATSWPKGVESWAQETPTPTPAARGRARAKPKSKAKSEEPTESSTPSFHIPGPAAVILILALLYILGTVRL